MDTFAADSGEQVTLRDFAGRTLAALLAPMLDTTSLEQGTFSEEEEKALFKAWQIRNQQIMEQALGFVFEQGQKSVNDALRGIQEVEAAGDKLFEVPQTSAE